MAGWLMIVASMVVLGAVQASGWMPPHAVVGGAVDSSMPAGLGRRTIHACEAEKGRGRRGALVLRGMCGGEGAERAPRGLTKEER